ncbi:MAG: multicopper oxidase domain-containing protein [Armatimonadota bacterium]
MVAVLIAFVANMGLIQNSKRVFQPLLIPEAIEGKSFNLNLHKSKKSFWTGATTPTYAYNKETFWGPTLIFKKGEKVQINVKNELDEPTTVHWHGFHIPAATDGGPHQLIKPGETWSPSFTVENNAATYWYHPHPHETTQNQLTSGAGGLIIIRDSEEAKLNLPRNYGVDDIPLSLTSRRFALDDKFTFNGDNDKYGDYELVNGVMDPETKLPSQWVRLRILNAEIERGYILGFSDNRTYYQIATDGGLVDKPIPLKRMKLMVGERVEILVDLSKDKVGNKIDLMSFNSNQPFGFPGGEAGSSPPNGGYLNNIDFRILRINVGATTANPVTSIPQVLAKNTFPEPSEISKERSLHITANNPGEPFAFDQKLYSMNRIDQVVKLGSVEKWTVTNNRIFGHSFHIHDVQFKIVSRSNGPVEEYEKGWKDSVYVPRDESVSFIAQFKDFASETDSFMYHCHMANHEDGGLMGQFLVVKDPTKVKRDTKGSVVFRAKTEHPVTKEMVDVANSQAQTLAPQFVSRDLLGKTVNLTHLSKSKPVVLFFIDPECPCSKEATPFFNRLQKTYGALCQVVGVTNSDNVKAKSWVKAVGSSFPVVCDPSLNIISAYQAENSVYTTIIGPGGIILKTFPGYGKAMFSELGAIVSKLNNITERPIKLSDAPTNIVAGCPFNIGKAKI